MRFQQMALITRKPRAIVSNKPRDAAFNQNKQLIVSS